MSMISKINQVLDSIKSDDEIYSNILKDFFTKGILTQSAFLKSLYILPELNPNNFQENKKILINKILSLKDKSEAYNCLSCIYGAFLGDAIGAYCEFKPSSRDNYKYIYRGKSVFGEKPGQVTDDSEMAMSMSYAIMEMPTKEKLDSNYLYFYYGAWARTNPIDIGNATQSALDSFHFERFHPSKKMFNTAKPKIIKENMSSLSNGFIMRKSTFIVWFYYQYNQLIQNAFLSSNIADLVNLYFLIEDLAIPDNDCTHPNTETLCASACLTILALGAILGKNPQSLIQTINDLYLSRQIECSKYIEGENKVKDLVRDSLNKFKDPQFNAYTYFTTGESSVNKAMGWYAHGLRMTIYYLEHFDKYKGDPHGFSKFRFIMNEICNCGGDTDTNCAIVGTVLGPIIGYNQLGKEFIDLISVFIEKRSIYSPCFMYIYVKYLEAYSKNRINPNNEKCYFIKMLLSILYAKLDNNMFNYLNINP